jgi:RNA-directed DNA polymerase
MGDTKDDIECARNSIAKWLASMGLELSPEKTRIVHSMQGFDFLSVQARHYKVGKYHSGIHNGPGGPKKLGFKTLIKPSKEAIGRHKRALQVALKKPLTPSNIQQMNRLIQGWSRYHSTETATRAYAALDHWLWWRIQARLKYLNPQTSTTVLKRRFQKNYKHEINSVLVAKHGAQKIVRHTKVQGNRSIFDGDWSYWTKRNMNYPALGKWTKTLLRWQQGKCLRCGLYFKSNDQMELDRLIPGRLGGKYELTNLQLLHRWCHDAKTAEDINRLALQ